MWACGADGSKVASPCGRGSTTASAQLWQQVPESVPLQPQGDLGGRRVWCAARGSAESKAKCGRVCARRCDPETKSLLVVQDAANDADDDAWGEKRGDRSLGSGTARCEQR
jgi:hypothetical protein